MNAAPQTNPVIFEEMDGLTEDQLYHLLGIRLEEAAFAGDPRSFVLSIGGIHETYGPPDALITLGKDFFNRVERQAFELMCGQDRASSAAREQIATAFPFGASDVAASLAAVLASHLAMGPGVAAVVAALVMKLFFSPALAATCDSWRIRLTRDEPNVDRSSNSPTA